MIGLNSFNVLVKINDLYNFNKNHYEIVDYFNLRCIKTIARELGTIVIKKENIENYDVYAIDEDLKIHKKNHLFITENKQILVFVNKNIEYPSTASNIINNKIEEYLCQSIPEYIDQVKNATYDNINKNIIKYNPFIYCQ
jgi:hypothetical protein